MREKRFAKCAWGVLAFNLAVILWGAFVRATGSGAGCGAHWPLCNGAVIPEAERLGTKIELTHRVTSGIAFLLVVALAVWAVRIFPRGSSVRRGAIASALFMVGEVVLGAGLVLLKLVENDKSILRGASLSVHLTNTFFLLAALALTAFWASGGAPVRLRRQGSLPWLFGAVFASVVLVGISGGIAALGDTLFPVSSHAEGLAEDFSPTAHVFVRLRLIHPFLAACVSVLALTTAGIVRGLRPSRNVRRAALVAGALVLAQVAAGVLNLWLLAPIPMQLVHLLLADLLWIALVLLAATALADEARSEVTAGGRRIASRVAGGSPSTMPTEPGTPEARSP